MYNTIKVISKRIKSNYGEDYDIFAPVIKNTSIRTPLRLRCIYKIARDTLRNEDGDSAWQSERRDSRTLTPAG